MNNIIKLSQMQKVRFRQIFMQMRSDTKWLVFSQPKYFVNIPKNDYLPDDLPQPTPIEKLEQEREDFYRKRNLKLYGQDTYEKVDPYSIEPEPKYEPMPNNMDTITPKDSERVRLRPKSKRDQSNEKNEGKQTKSPLLFKLGCILVACSFYGVYSNAGEALLQYKILSNAVRDDARVDQISYKTLKKDKVRIKIIVKKNQKLSYESLEDIIFTKIKPATKDFNPKIAYLCSIQGIFGGITMYLFSSNAVSGFLRLPVILFAIMYSQLCWYYAFNFYDIDKMYMVKRKSEIKPDEKNSFPISKFMMIMSHDENEKFKQKLREEKEKEKEKEKGDKK